MLKLLSALVCAALVTIACGSRPTSPETGFPVMATLQPGQTVSTGGLTVKFVGVTNESRCPAAAICITSGDATMQFALSVSSQMATEELKVNHPDERRTQYAGFTVEVETLAPYPITFNSIKPGDYRVTLKIDR
jgi:hypothetical protein